MVVAYNIIMMFFTLSTIIPVLSERHEPCFKISIIINAICSLCLIALWIISLIKNLFILII